MAAAAILLCGVALFFVPPAGCNALPLAVACLWRWPPPVQDWLAARLRLGRRALDVVGVTLAAVAAVVNLTSGGQLDGHLVHAGDFQTYWLGATIGSRYGWSRLFDESLQQSLWPSVGGAGLTFLPFLNPPPVAWLVVPLLALPYVAAYTVWVVLMTACAALVLVLVVPRAWLPVAGVLSVGLWVVPYTLASGQNAVLGALAVALTWRLLHGGRPGWAGLALTLIDVRPTATLLVPLALLVAGYRRTFLVWLALTAVLGAFCVWSVGANGMSQFVHLALEIRVTFPRAQQMTILGWLQPGALAVAVELALAAAAIAAAWRSGQKPDVVLGAGVLASLFATPYIHMQDYLAPLTAAGTTAASTVRASFGLVVVALFVAAPPGWIFGAAWEGALLAAEVGWLAWILWTAFGKRPAVGAARVEIKAA